MKITSPSSGCSVSPDPRSVNDSPPVGESDGQPVRDRGKIEDRHGQRVPDTDEVADVDERVDRRDRALLRQASKERLGRRSIGGRVDAEAPERPTPRVEARDLGERRVAKPLEDHSLFGREGVGETSGRGTVPDAVGMDHATDDRREPLRDLLLVLEQRHAA
jgi:hypothetical protein